MRSTGASDVRGTRVCCMRVCVCVYIIKVLVFLYAPNEPYSTQINHVARILPVFVFLLQVMGLRSGNAVTCVAG